MLNTPLHISDDLLVKYMLDEAVPGEALAVEAWLNADAANRNYYEHFRLIWERSETLSANITVDTAAAWQRLQHKITAGSNASRATAVFRLPRLQPLQVAAVALLLITGAWVIYRSFNPAAPLAMVSKQTGWNTLTDTLSDGSIITLNKQTTVRYPARFEPAKRTVQLKGEAFFKVTPDKERPFIVQAGNVTIRVVGTAFNVNNYDSSTSVVVESGKVRVTHGDEWIELEKGEQVLIRHNSGALEKSLVKDSLYSYYRTRQIVCNNTPLPDVIATINRAYNTKIVLGDEALRQLRLSATFSQQRLETVLDIIQKTFNLQVTQQGDSTVLRLQ